MRKVTRCALLLLLGVSTNALAASGDAEGYVQLKRERFQQQVDGKAVDLYTLKNSKGMVVKVTNYGAKIEQILVPDRNGTLGDVVLGYESLDQVMTGQPSMGAFIGRYANRIGGGTFAIDGKPYQATLNDGPNSLHGGKKGSRFVVFDAKQIDDRTVEMRYTYKDGEEGYPGSVPSRVVYTVTDDNALDIAFDATTDKPTIVNFTSHSFFNLAGEGSSTILGHQLQINASRFTPVDSTLITTGELRPVKGTPLDFTSPQPVGARIHADYDQLGFVKGYDHNFVIDKKPGEFGLMARIAEPLSGRVMEVYGTQPGIQFYSGNFLAGAVPKDVGKGGHVYGFQEAFCLEPQNYPDAPNKAGFPSPVLRPGETYSGKIVYKFLVQK
ncbi:MAG TPA: aldose epimerase family protein [Azospirillum sp.]|nr:aldose epimerase family protein [Azospirillum sp.]